MRPLPSLPVSVTPLPWWLLAMVAWIAGAACQISEASLRPSWAYALGCGLGALGMMGASWVRGRCAPRRRVWTARVLCLALWCMAWGSTGLRAVRTLSEQWPLAWQNQEVGLCVQAEGLPQPLDGGGVMFDARVLAASSLVSDSAPGVACTGSAPPKAQSSPVSHVSLASQPGDGMDAIEAGQIWRVVARLHTPDGASNPGGFDATLVPFERGVRAMGSVRGKAMRPVLVSVTPRWPWQGTIDRARQRLRGAIQAHVADEHAAGVLAGLAVGDQSGIDRADWDVFRRTGVSHLVSISGTHIAMLGWLVSGWVRWAWSRSERACAGWPAPEVARWSGVLASLLYAALAGWGVPAQRTVLMMALMAWLRSGTRWWPWPLVWLASAAVVVVLDPWALRQAGFWLSYVAVGVLMASGQEAEADAQEKASPQADPVSPSPPVWREHAQRAWTTVRQTLREMVHTQWLVTLTLTPLTLVCFQQVSVVGVFANFLAIPVFTLGITPLALLGVVCPPAWDVAAWLVTWTMGWLSAWAAWSWAVWQVPVLPTWVAWGAVLGAWVLAFPVPRAWRGLALPFFLPLFWLPAPWLLVVPPRPGQFQILAADVGQGTGVLVQTARHTLLFDTGPKVGRQSDAGERVLVPMMRAIGVRQLDVLVISHQDSDHVGGAPSVLAGMPVSQVISSLDAAHPVLAQHDQAGVLPVHQPCQAGQQWDWDGVRFSILHPTAADLARRAQLPPNALSCVLKVTRLSAGKAPSRTGSSSLSTSPLTLPSVLLPGDIEADQEQAILSRLAKQDGGVSALRSTVLLVPHHGSKTSSTPAFLQAVSPALSLIQAGRRNRYGHPAPSILARYEGMGLRTLGTPQCGAFLWASDAPEGRCWRTTSAHEGPALPERGAEAP